MGSGRLLWYLNVMVPAALGQGDPLGGWLRVPPISTWLAVAGQLHALHRALVLSTMGLFTLVVLGVALRSRPLAVAAMAGILLLAYVPGVSGPWDVAFGTLAAAITLFVLLRHGLLALVALAFASEALQAPLTADPSAWYATGA